MLNLGSEYFYSVGRRLKRPFRRPVVSTTETVVSTCETAVFRTFENVGNFSAIIHARAFSYREGFSLSCVDLDDKLAGVGGSGGAGAPPAKFRLV